MQMYEQEHGKKMQTSAIAAMLSTMLYQRRFFPYYVYNIIAGLDDQGDVIGFPSSHPHHQYLSYWSLSSPVPSLPMLLVVVYWLVGKGCVYSFDPVGSYERESFRAGGSASAMLQPLLDNQVC